MADTAEWTRADQLLIGEKLSTISGTAELQSVLYTTERVPVYNLSIPGTPTYDVGEHGIWVHNCEIDANKLRHLFGNPNHYLDDLVDVFGGQESAYRAILDGTERTVSRLGITGRFEESVNVAGYLVVVRGNVIDGVVKIGTAFAP